MNNVVISITVNFELEEGSCILRRNTMYKASKRPAFITWKSKFLLLTSTNSLKAKYLKQKTPDDPQIISDKF